MGVVPTTAPSAESGCIGFMNAGFGCRFFFSAIVTASRKNVFWRL
jgi:hypothetical protein